MKACFNCAFKGSKIPVPLTVPIAAALPCLECSGYDKWEATDLAQAVVDKFYACVKMGDEVKSLESALSKNANAAPDNAEVYG